MKKITSLILTITMLLSIISSLTITASAIGNYGVNIDSASYTSNDNPFTRKGYWGQCTWYCWGRANENGVSLWWGSDSYGNAMDWYKNAEGYYQCDQNPSANSIMVSPDGWAGDTRVGHVMFVEKVENGYAYISEANYYGSDASVISWNGKKGRYHEDVINLSTNRRSNGTAVTITGYIHLRCTKHTWDNGKITAKADCKHDGIKTYTCTVCGETKTKAIKGGHKYTEKVAVKANLLTNGKVLKECSVCGKKASGTIYHIKTVKLKKSVFIYNGKSHKPDVVVKDTKGKDVDPKYYTVTYSNNKNVGMATATVKFKTRYYGVSKKTFGILPQGTSISDITERIKGFTVKWKKQANQITGYQIQYAADSKFKTSPKTVTVKNVKTVSKTIQKLKSNTKYYVRIRTYKKVSGLPYYSSWSKAKSVKTLKNINWSSVYFNYVIENMNSIRWYDSTYSLNDDLPLALHDFDSNGIPELIIGYPGARLGLTVYTIYGGKVVYAGGIGGKASFFSSDKDYHGIFRSDSWMSGAEGGIWYSSLSRGKLISEEVLSFSYNTSTKKFSTTIKNKTLYNVYVKCTKPFDYESPYRDAKNVLKLYYWKDIRSKGWNKFIKYFGYKTSEVYSGKSTTFKIGGNKISLKLPSNWKYKKQTYNSNKYLTFYEKNTYEETNGRIGTICSLVCMTKDGYNNLKNGIESYVYYGKIGSKYYAMVWLSGYGYNPNTDKLFDKALHISYEVALSFKSSPKAKK